MSRAPVAVFIAVALVVGACATDDADVDAGASDSATNTSDEAPGAVAQDGDDHGNGATAGDDVMVLSVGDAASRSVPVDDVQVRGFLIETGGQVFLSEALAESFPPQPGGALIEVTGIDMADVAGAQSVEDTTWTDTFVVVHGRLDGGVLAGSQVTPEG